MKKIWKEKDEWGQDVIYVKECTKFKYEHQKDLPKLNKKYEEVDITTSRLPTKQQYDILYSEENYYKLR